MSFAAGTVDGLSRWAGEAMETLGHERDRARALHRENAQVSREATMAQKEIMTLEGKLFHAGKEVSVSCLWVEYLQGLLRITARPAGRVRGFLNSHGSSRFGSGSLLGRVGSVKSGHVGSGHLDPTRPCSRQVT